MSYSRGEDGRFRIAWVSTLMTDYETYLAGQSEDVLVLKLPGRLDDHSARCLDDSIEEHVERGIIKVVLDCSKLRHISSRGLGTLIRLHSRLQNQGGYVKLAHVDNTLADVLHIVHFEKLFHLYPTVAEACESFEVRRDESA